jgi:hypothetical protein
MKVAFIEQPNVNFSLSLIGGDIDLLPGVKVGPCDCIPVLKAPGSRA